MTHNNPVGSRAVPYRNAHWAALAMLPVIVLAFWPVYLAQLRDAPIVLHAHGMIAFPTPLLVLMGVVLATAALWQGWARVPNRRRFGDATALGPS
jgi:hypothetical protein